jgi:spore maturation protein A
LLQASEALNKAAFDAATSSVEICLGLIGAMALWLGLLKVAQDAGMVDALARGLRPLMRWLFPGVPDGHPAQGAILMNMSANMLGLDNAATPMGLKAMRELQTLNPTEDTATNDMAMFLAINTSSVTLIPFTIIAYRVAKHSENATEPLFGMILATTVSTTVAIIAVRWLSRWPVFAMPDQKLPVVDGPNAVRPIDSKPSPPARNPRQSE